MSELNIKGTEEWVREWNRTYEQGERLHTLSRFVGKTVKAESPDDKHGFTGYIVGYSKDTVFLGEWDYACRYSLITGEGLQMAIFKDMKIEVVEEE